MKNLIKALNIFSKYMDTEYPTHCEHDVLMVDCRKDIVSEEDKQKLEDLTFMWSDEHDVWISYHYGSC